MMLYLAVAIFIIVMIVVAFELVDKAIAALSGAVIFVIIGVLPHEKAIKSVDFETILLLMGMMMLVEASKRSGIFSWLNVRVAKITRGNPFLLLVLFLGVTALLSAFLDNVTTVLLIVPVTLALTKGMGLKPAIYVIAEVIFSNIGGSLTLIGDPPNILIGSASGLSFNDFILNLIIPISIVSVAVLTMIAVVHWKEIKPVHADLEKLFVSNLLIRKINYQFLNTNLDKVFIIKTLVILGLVFIGFMTHSLTHLSVDIIAVFFALVFLIIGRKNLSIHHILKEVEWTTLLFFAGLFVMVGGLKEVGFLELISSFILSLTDNFSLILLIILWVSALVSSFLDNIPFVAVMIPVIVNLQTSFSGNPHLDLLWWSLSLGACLGGNGTIIGASANVVAVDLARKEGVNISFLDFMKVGFPVLIISMIICSLYLLVRSDFF